jgi:carboxypeptidase A1
MIPNVQQLVDGQEEANNALEGAIQNGPYPAFFNQYHNLTDLNNYAAGLVEQYPNLAKMVSIGKSYQGRDINAIIITSPKGTPSKSIYYEGGIHAREWIAHASTMFVLYSLLNGYGNDTEITKLVDSFQFHIVWTVNPDGYVFTWTKNRMWRKTMSPNAGSSCIGSDPNRNWDNHWCEKGASRDPCDDAYCGPRAFSEVETKAVADYVTKVGNVIGFIDFHAYSQLWMQPYGWTGTKPKDFSAQQKCGLAATGAIKKSHGLTYQEGSIYVIIYPASGSSADWAYDQGKIKYPYGVELRDTGRYGFLLPPDQIIPTGEEVLAAVEAMADCMLTTEAEGSQSE